MASPVDPHVYIGPGSYIGVLLIGLYRQVCLSVRVFLIRRSWMHLQLIFHRFYMYANNHNRGGRLAFFWVFFFFPECHFDVPPPARVVPCQFHGPCLLSPGVICFGWHLLISCRFVVQLHGACQCGWLSGSPRIAPVPSGLPLGPGVLLLSLVDHTVAYRSLLGMRLSSMGPCRNAPFFLKKKRRRVFWSQKTRHSKKGNFKVCFSGNRGIVRVM